VNCGLEARSTIRANPNVGREEPSSPTVCCDLRVIGLSRPVCFTLTLYLGMNIQGKTGDPPSPGLSRKGESAILLPSPSMMGEDTGGGENFTIQDLKTFIPPHLASPAKGRAQSSFPPPA